MKNNLVKVFVADDESITRMIICRRLEKDYYIDKISEFENGSSLYDHCKKHGLNDVSLIVSDHNMPGKNGLDVIRKLQEKYPYANTKYFLMSAYSPEELGITDSENGSFAYLQKPFNLDNFLTECDVVLERKKR